MKLKNKIKLITFICIIISFFCNTVYAKENFFDKAKNLYDKKKYEDSKFLFQRNIVFNPKHAKSYIYLAKIYLEEKNEFQEEKNLNTALLLDPNNEEWIQVGFNPERHGFFYTKSGKNVGQPVFGAEDKP